MELLILKYVTPDCISMQLTKEGLNNLDNYSDGDLNWLLDQLGDRDICLANEINDGYSNFLIDGNGFLFELDENDIVTLKETAILDGTVLEINIFNDLENYIDKSDEKHMNFYNWFHGNKN